jgi:hypothetical protein
MASRTAALSAVSLVTLVYCGGQAVVQTTPDSGQGGASSSSSGGSGSGGSGSGGSSGSTGSSGGAGSSGGSSSGTGSSSSGSGPDASEDAPSCVGHYDGGTRPAPTDHRAEPGTCPATTAATSCLSSYADAGAGAACTTSADCVPDGSYTPYSVCLHGHCAVDHCLADSDCPSGQACLCGSQQYGNACFHANQCVPADCRLDSDCGAGSYCSPNPGACGIESGYHCHKATDSCFNNADCACAGGYASTCAYSSTVGAWVCTQITCAG